jgi:hypothetical protein
VRLTEEKRKREVSAQIGPKPPQTGVGQGVGGGRPEVGINAAARELGIERKQAQRAIAIDGLSAEAKAEAVAVKLDDNQCWASRCDRSPTKRFISVASGRAAAQ